MARLKPELQITCDVPEFMHGHRKKLRFFARCLSAYAADHSLRFEQVKVLDLGCGNGENVATPLARLGFNVTGVDPHQPSIEFAMRSSPSNLHLIISGYENFVTNDVFDVVVLSDVLEHVSDPERLVRSARSLLKNGGEVLISIPNGFGPYEIEQYLIRIGVLRPPLLLARAVAAAVVAARSKGRSGRRVHTATVPRNVESGHVQRFTHHSLKDLVRGADLTIIDSANGSWFGGDLTYFAFQFIPSLVPLTLKVADYLPHQLVSTWYFRCATR